MRAVKDIAVEIQRHKHKEQLVTISLGLTMR